MDAERILRECHQQHALNYTKFAENLFYNRAIHRIEMRCYLIRIVQRVLPRMYRRT